MGKHDLAPTDPPTDVSALEASTMDQAIGFSKAAAHIKSMAKQVQLLVQ